MHEPALMIALNFLLVYDIGHVFIYVCVVVYIERWSIIEKRSDQNGGKKDCKN